MHSYFIILFVAIIRFYKIWGVENSDFKTILPGFFCFHYVQPKMKTAKRGVSVFVKDELLNSFKFNVYLKISTIVWYCIADVKIDLK